MPEPVNRLSRAQRTTIRIRLEQTHRNLYYAYTAYAFMSVALGLNFLFLKPTFDPLNIPKGAMGAIFLTLGLSKLILLNFYRSPTLLRLVMASIIAVMFFFCGALTVSFFKLHQTSLQLPLTYFALAFLGLPLLAEPFVNPATTRNGGQGK